MSARLSYRPGLLVEGAPVYWGMLRAVVVALSDHGGIAAIAWEDGGLSATEDDVPLAALELDLSTRMGCALAAWWVDHRLREASPGRPMDRVQWPPALGTGAPAWLTSAHYGVLHQAMRGTLLAQDELALLCSMALRLTEASHA